MGGNEILKHGKAFPEIGANGRFNDFARRFCHKTPHPCKLTHLIFTPPGTGIRHHIYGVEAFFHKGISRLVQDRLTIAVGDRGHTQGFHHFIRHIVGCLCPNIDDLIIFFTLSDKPLGILSADLFSLLFGIF